MSSLPNVLTRSNSSPFYTRLNSENLANDPNSSTNTSNNNNNSIAGPSNASNNNIRNRNNNNNITNTNDPNTTSNNDNSHTSTKPNNTNNSNKTQNNTAKSVTQQLQQIEYDQISKIEFYKNGTTAKCVITQLDLSPKNIRRLVKNYFNEHSEFIGTKKRPGAIISVTGGARYYEIRSLKLERIIKRGFLQAARNLGAWIVDGGMNAGVMKYIGKSIQSMSVTHIPCIGVATYRKVTNYNSLKKASKKGVNYVIDYEAKNEGVGDTCDLDPNHTHFVLVDSGKDMEWGEEIDMLIAVQTSLAEKDKIPLVIIAFNGGKGTLDVIAKGLLHNSPVIVIQSTGRISDAVSELIIYSKKNNIKDPNWEQLEKSGEDFPEWQKFLKECKSESQRKELVKTMDVVLHNCQKVTIFDPNDEDSEGLDIIILRNVVVQERSILKKLNHCIAWGDGCDMLREILEDSAKDPSEARKEELSTALNYALAEALWLNRPNIFGMLCDHHATFPHPLRYLYRHHLVVDQLKRGHVWLTRRWYYWPMYIRELTFSWFSDSDAAELGIARPGTSPPRLKKIMALLSQVGPAFHGYAKRFERRYFASDSAPEIDCTFTDLLIWAVFVNRVDLAKQIWKRTTYPVHSALLACSLYRYLSSKAIRTQEYIDNSHWFEQQADEIMTLLQYSEAEKLLAHPWESMTGKKITLEDIAVEGDCKQFMSHPHYQQMLDEMLYSYDEKCITTSKSNTHIIMTIIFTFILWIPLSFANSYKKTVSEPQEEITNILRSNSDSNQKLTSSSSSSSSSSPSPSSSPSSTTPAKQEDNNNNNNNNSNNTSNNETNTNRRLRRATISHTHSQRKKLVLPSASMLNLPTFSPPPSLSSPPLPESKKGKEKEKDIEMSNMSVQTDDSAENDRKKLDEEEKEIEQMEKENPNSQDEFLHIYPPVYFNIPIVKFWTNALFYCAFLFLQAYIVVTLTDQPISIPEYVLWGWIFSFFVLEIQQSVQQHGYFSHFSNKIDLLLIVLHVSYIVLRLVHQQTGHFQLLSGSINTLIVACVVSWLRLMAIFPISSTFGPLFFIIAQLFTRDFVLWVILFAIFAVSFQIGFYSLAVQANLSPLDPYPDGPFPITYFSIIGDFSYLMPAMSTTPIGVAFLGIYTFVAQVMLVNLLIAMMGDTYTTVRQNSDIEWKCYRRVFVSENRMAPALPPPLNLLWYMYLPIRKLLRHLKNSRLFASKREIALRNVTQLGIYRSQKENSRGPTVTFALSASRDSTQSSISPHTSPSTPHTSPSTPHISHSSSPFSSHQQLPQREKDKEKEKEKLGSYSYYQSSSQLLDTELDEAEDIAKVMRVTLDKMSEKNERDESESPLAQIKQAKRMLLAESTTEKNVENKIEQLQRTVEFRGGDGSTPDTKKQIAELEIRLRETFNESLADQSMKIRSLEKQLQEANTGISQLLSLFHSLPTSPSPPHPHSFSTSPPQRPLPSSSPSPNSPLHSPANSPPNSP